MALDNPPLDPDMKVMREPFPINALVARAGAMPRASAAR